MLTITQLADKTNYTRSNINNHLLNAIQKGLIQDRWETRKLKRTTKTVRVLTLDEAKTLLHYMKQHKVRVAPNVRMETVISPDKLPLIKQFLNQLPTYYKRYGSKGITVLMKKVRMGI